MASFDPHAFVSDFDPEKFAGGGEEETPDEAKLRESFLDKSKFRPSAGHRKFENTGPIEQVKAELDPSQVHTPTAAEAVTVGPLDIADKYTLGGYGGLLRALGRVGVPGMAEGAESIQRYRRESPIVSGVTGAPAYVAEGPVSALFGGINRGAELAFNNPILRAAATSALGSGVVGGVQAASEGATPKEAAETALESAGAGGLVGGGLGVGARALGALGRAVQNSRGGQARQFIEEHGGTVRPGGVDLEGDYVTTGTSDKDIGRQAGVSARKVLRELGREHRGARAAIGAQKARITEGEAQAALDAQSVPEPILEGNETEQIPRQSMAETMGEARPREEPISRPPTDEEAVLGDRKLRKTVQIPVQTMAEMTGQPAMAHEAEPPAPRSGGELHDVSDVVSKMREVADGIGVHDAQRAQLQNEIAAITKRQGADFNPETDNYFLSESDVNELRGKLDRLGKVGESTDAKLRPVQQAAHELRKITEAGPYGDVNRQFAEEYARHGRAREQLGLQPKTTKSRTTKAEVSQVRNLITRNGQNTVTAGGQEPDLEAFRRENPNIAPETFKPELLRKRADISFHLLPQRHGGFIERTGNVGLAAPFIEAALHAAGHGLGIGPTAGSVAAGLALQNLPAIQARLLYGPALSAQAAEPLILGEIPLLAAARNAHAEER